MRGRINVSIPENLRIAMKLRDKWLPTNWSNIASAAFIHEMMNAESEKKIRELEDRFERLLNLEKNR